MSNSPREIDVLLPRTVFRILWGSEGKGDIGNADHT